MAAAGSTLMRVATSATALVTSMKDLGAGCAARALKLQRVTRCYPEQLSGPLSGPRRCDRHGLIAECGGAAAIRGHP